MVTLSRPYHGGLTPGVIADQRKALADTTELTDTVYFVHPNGIRTLNPWVSKQQHCISILFIVGLGSFPFFFMYALGLTSSFFIESLKMKVHTFAQVSKEGVHK